MTIRSRQILPFSLHLSINLPAAGSYKPGDYLRAVSQVYGLPMAQIGQLQTAAAMLDVATADVEVDAEEKGSGITPILGVNICLE